MICDDDEDEWGVKLLQHPLVASFILLGAFKAFNPFVVIFVGAYNSQSYVEIGKKKPLL